MRNTKMTTAAGISLAALLALTACGDDTDADAETNGEAASEETGETVFDFGDNTDVSGEEIRIELPEDLADTEGRVLDAAVVRAGEDAESDCAIEVSYEYADGVEAEIESHEWASTPLIGYQNEPYDEAPVENRYAKVLGFDEDPDALDDSITHGYGVEYLAEDLQSATFPVECGTGSTDVRFRNIDEWVDPEMGDNSEEPDGVEIYHPGVANLSTIATVEVGFTGDNEVSVVSSEIH